jgi:ATP-binding cassette subfamily A (ABC1) protein 3
LKTIYNQPEKLHGLVGYCPQINSIEKTLTVKDSLWYLCEMIGVRKDTVEDVVTNTIARFDLTDYTNTKAGVLSGGNKRKLCCAQAMLGNPKAIFIDEASTGVDPVARRKIWKAMQFEAANSGLILTTHTMEEAEILATKIGIMVGGKLKCFGTL